MAGEFAFTVSHLFPAKTRTYN